MKKNIREYNHESLTHVSITLGLFDLFMIVIAIWPDRKFPSDRPFASGAAAVCLVLAGVAALRRGGIRVDAGVQKVTRWWGFPRPLVKLSYPLREFSSVRVFEGIDTSGSHPSREFVVELQGPKRKIRLPEAFVNLDDAVEKARELKWLTGLKLINDCREKP